MASGIEGKTPDCFHHTSGGPGPVSGGGASASVPIERSVPVSYNPGAAGIEGGGFTGAPHVQKGSPSPAVSTTGSGLEGGLSINKS